MDLSPGEIPDQPGVHGAEQQLAPLGPGPGAGHIVQNPLDLGAGEVGVDEQAGFVPDIGGHAVGGQLIADGGGAAALPDDGVVHGFAGGLVPDNGGLPLVGDADAGDVRGGQAALFKGLAQGVELGVQNDHGVMLHPAGLGVNLGEGVLGQGDDVPGGVEDDGPGAGGALVQGDQISVHG